MHTKHEAGDVVDWNVDDPDPRVAFGAGASRREIGPGPFTVHMVRAKADVGMDDGGHTQIVCLMRKDHVLCDGEGEPQFWSGAYLKPV